MRWQGERESANVEDRRGGGLGGIGIAGGGIGAVVIALVAMFFGVDPSVILDSGSGSSTAPSGYPAPRDAGSAQDDRMKQFVSVVLAETEDTWTDVFRQMGREYQQPRLVLFSGAVQSACGMAQSATGPFYCPGDRKAYLDFEFFDELSRRFRAPGDFAQAYVIAHEIGHHVQNLLGITGKVEGAQGRGSAQRNALSVRLELQADCFAGVWANHTEQRRHVLEQGDVEEAMQAAAAVGDDRLQRQSRGYVVPESFTHGSSAQRVRWFKRGFESGSLRQCDTFSADAI
jgi:predicted metalloprotease